MDLDPSPILDIDFDLFTLVSYSMASLLSAVTKFKGRKRGLIDLSSPTSYDGDNSMAMAVAQMAEDDGTPQHIKVILAYLLESKEKIDALMAENERLYDEIRRLREENTGLKHKLASKEETHNSSHDVSPCSPPKSDFQTQVELSIGDYEAKEMSRSLIVSGVPELKNTLPSARLCHDFDCIRRLLDFLNVECVPISVYRMGRARGDKPRILKVVLPSSKFRDLALVTATRIKRSPFRATFIRPSLPPEQRGRVVKPGNNHRALQSTGSQSYPTAVSVQDHSPNTSVSDLN